MAWTAPVDPVAGTVITVTYAVQNILDPLRWLRIMTGNADPPASNYVPVSSSTAAVAWSKVPADALASGAVVSHLGYTPVNRSGDDAMLNNFRTTGLMSALGFGAGASGLVSSGPITTTGALSANGNGAIGGSFNVVFGITAGSYGGGSTAAGSPSFLGVGIGVNGLSTTGGIVSSSGIATISGAGISSAGQISAASYAGGSVALGGISVLGLGVGTSGIALGGPIVGTAGSSLSVNGSIASLANVSAVGQVSAGTFNGGATTVGGVSALGLAAGAAGVVSTGPIMYGAEQVYSPSNPPPIAGGGASVPAGLIAFIATGAVPTGWSFYPAANGRVIVAAGSASVGNPQTFAVGNNYGADWSHLHGPNTFTVSGSATFGPSDMTQTSGDVNGLATAGGVNLNTTAHRHSLNGASAAVSGSATGSTAGAVWVPPAHALNAIIKSP